MITNQDGQIALKWTIIQRSPPLVKIDGTSRVYVFSPKMNIFMAWVLPEDASKLLTTKHKVCNCNNGTYKIAFGYAHYLDVLLWETGSRDGKLDERYKEV